MGVDTTDLENTMMNYNEIEEKEAFMREALKEADCLAYDEIPVGCLG